MKKLNRLPREQLVDGPDGAVTRDDGLNATSDVEGHAVPREFAPRLPGTGGDFRRPSGGGEVDGDDDVEGHAVAPGFAPRLPGTGGDFRRPSGGGEIVGDDGIEGPHEG